MCRYWFFLFFNFFPLHEIRSAKSIIAHITCLDNEHSTWGWGPSLGWKTCSIRETPFFFFSFFFFWDDPIEFNRHNPYQTPPKKKLKIIKNGGIMRWWRQYIGILVAPSSLLDSSFPLSSLKKNVNPLRVNFKCKLFSFYGGKKKGIKPVWKIGTFFLSFSRPLFLLSILAYCYWLVSATFAHWPNCWQRRDQQATISISWSYIFLYDTKSILEIEVIRFRNWIND